ncbi:MAG TPA: ribosome maturation factor RimP [Rubrivivax sp.]|nr:ribosome maturation factor RimP [Rubrivivax sp.]
MSAAHERAAIGAAVSALGYELVDIEREARGLLRVTIDRLPDVSYPSGPGESVTVDDCEYVTRQLQYALEVGAVPYERLEVSSPGLDRALRTEAHYERFAGALVALELKIPYEGRRAFKGVLGRGEAGGWTLVFDDGKGAQVLGFELDEVREARLVPVLDFKGRRQSKGQDADVTAASAPQDGGQDR